ncbi:hypothetical protein [Citrobacter rodentium]|uniref:Exported protein n=2 Tax=Citrobacter rodentium TaxID=67825 RepID=D2TUD7_CITRI|nr:hypothetical protein [Citrobacter rodentium]KIQ51515.1 hypothetical protein TA05_09795 [Citrobacter rodentium]QBY27834.1 hypothetical protein E2R62_02630 [Citrobacter rodentium]UHO30278.1 hypothetical protein K7R23_20190 [Citrobacter rodentium NBRC 105723 = DSM 16636]CBG87990.1 Putative exported protein [Citrobacter rodentium ICC168]HAT8013874.1 hypothetical protein [Citrobacter rodentium NBRC 105723 = DSM 16636]
MSNPGPLVFFLLMIFLVIPGALLTLLFIWQAVYKKNKKGLRHVFSILAWLSGAFLFFIVVWGYGSFM